jgi:nucleoside diphosphate kinase
VRAFPESLFHLRPDDVVTPDGFKDREPFPRIADKQWIGQEYSSYVLFDTEDTTIYPFKEKGRILGNDIDQFISEQDNLPDGKSYGCILLKPDAIKRDQAQIIKQKIVDGISKADGKIVVEKNIDKLSDDDVEKMYPMLQGEDLSDAKKYLSSGPIVAYLIEAPISQLDMFNLLSEIKGPRLSDRTNARLVEGRIEDGAIRDLIPLLGDEALYDSLIPTILRKRRDSEARFSKEQYAYYSRNLAHTPDNSVEMHGLLKATGIKLPF